MASQLYCTFVANLSRLSHSLSVVLLLKSLLHNQLSLGIPFYVDVGASILAPRNTPAPISLPHTLLLN